MAQQLFAATVPPANNSLAFLDANFSELYRIWNQAHFDGANKLDRLFFNGSAGSYVTFQSASVAIGDVGTADNIFSGGGAGDFALTSRAGNLELGTGSTRRVRIDSTGNVLAVSGGGLGYGSGAGGTVTQITSKSTTVTLNKPTGQITTNSASLAAGGVVAFVLNSTSIAATDLVLCQRASTSTGGDNAYDVKVDRIASGAAVIVIKNNTGGALAEAIVITFAVIKAATS